MRYIVIRRYLYLWLYIVLFHIDMCCLCYLCCFISFCNLLLFSFMFCLYHFVVRFIISDCVTFLFWFTSFYVFYVIIRCIDVIFCFNMYILTSGKKWDRFPLIRNLRRSIRPHFLIFLSEYSKYYSTPIESKVQ